MNFSLGKIAIATHTFLYQSKNNATGFWVGMYSCTPLQIMNVLPRFVESVLLMRSPVL
ncbi:hypothetical protein [Anabaena azotica]|uniref:Uncharacterized protein n=1 Tax=Anabaena azotica FACHB-119 TaxID=947527 RepID=A0ABR8D539_9NOST|nr:hypothetical protein [Anabaena azotica]MBD2502274.1 hypothetical protein [Anabaena azotica FACHB-119]